MNKKPVILTILASMMLAAHAEAFQTPLTTVRVASGLARPLFVTAPTGDNSRIFIAEQFSGTTGRVRILNIPGNTLNATPYLSITGLNASNEEGLLGLAFHPDFSAAPGNVNRGAFFIYYTSGGNNHVVRYTATADVKGPDPTAATADATSAQTVIDFSHPGQTNHNGGWIGFGPDGYLYIATGDGGGACDSAGNAQNINSLMGKMHRLDVNADQNPGSSTIWGYVAAAGNPYIGVAGLDEIWHFGLRNPFRCSFDRLNGNLYIGDVGQNFREEISFASGGVGNINFGWDVREGFGCSSGGSSGCASTCSTTGRTDPIWDIAWTADAIIGGYVYRGALIPDFKGTYFYAVYGVGQIFSFRYLGVPLTAGNVTNRTTELVPTGPVGGLAINTVTSFGEDAAGELYLCDRGTGANGEVFKIVVNCAGSALSFASQPGDQNPSIGQTVFLTVTLSGARGLTTYTWRKDGNIVGTDSQTLILNNVSCHDNGLYTCTVSDQCGTIISDGATLTVPLPPGDIEGDCDCDFFDVDTFVNVLLDLDADPDHISRSDVNGDIATDALDIQALVDTVPNWPC
jgi:glucose/arabinose dehydrogenase